MTLEFTDQDIVAAARECVGTAWEHQGRSVQKGIDCVGLIICIGRSLGLRLKDNKNYSRRPDGVTLVKEFDDQLVPLGGHICDAPCREEHDLTLAPGRVVVFCTRRRRMPTHVGIITPWPHGGLGMVHVYLDVGECVEGPLDAYFLDVLHKVYDWPRGA